MIKAGVSELEPFAKKDCYPAFVGVVPTAKVRLKDNLKVL
jgi:hypothetical protein